MMMKKGFQEPIRVLTVCGVGMGSSLILRMTAEKAFKELGVNAKVEATDLSSAKSMKADVILGQGMHTSEFEGMAPVVLAISNFVNVGALKEKLVGPLRAQGWMA
jgi:PTS system ascorbate-specific IIB component